MTSHPPASNCPNCAQPGIPSGYAYCPHCGQARRLHRINGAHLAHEAVHYFTHADKGIFHLLRALATRPGLAARSYIDGRRKWTFPPLTFFLLVAGIVAFLLTTMDPPASGARSASLRAAAERVTDLSARQSMLQTAGRIDRTQIVTTRYANLLAMLATPLAALVFFLFYRKERFNYAEHLVANMYFVAFSVLIYAALFVPLRQTGLLPPLFAFAAYFLFEIAYRTWAYRDLMQAYTAMGAFKAGLASLASILLWILLTFSLITTYIRNGWWGLAG